MKVFSIFSFIISVLSPLHCFCMSVFIPKTFYSTPDLATFVTMHEGSIYVFLVCSAVGAPRVEFGCTD
jgi:hypothetical protein